MANTHFPWFSCDKRYYTRIYNSVVPIRQYRRTWRILPCFQSYIIKIFRRYNSPKDNRLFRYNFIGYIWYNIY